VVTRINIYNEDKSKSITVRAHVDHRRDLALISGMWLPLMGAGNPSILPYVVVSSGMAKALGIKFPKGKRR
jgi:hypothetical protein